LFCEIAPEEKTFLQSAADDSGITIHNFYIPAGVAGRAIQGYLIFPTVKLPRS